MHGRVAGVHNRAAELEAAHWLMRDRASLKHDRAPYLPSQFKWFPTFIKGLFLSFRGRPFAGFLRGPIRVYPSLHKPLLGEIRLG